MASTLLAVLGTALLLAATATAQSASYQWSNTYNAGSFCEAPPSYGTYTISVSQGWQKLGLSDNLQVMFNGSTMLLNCTGICNTVWPSPCASYITYLDHISLNTTMPLEVYRDLFVGPCAGDPACYTEFVQGVTVNSEEHVMSVQKYQQLQQRKHQHA